MKTLNLQDQRSREAHRRLGLLGNQADIEYDYDQARDRAFAVGVPFKIWKGWLDVYQTEGLEGLMPDWEELDERTEAIVLERRRQLGDEVNDDTIPLENVAAIVAKRNDWTYKRAKRWVRRYRIGGLWGLAPQNNPEKPRRPKGHKRALGTLDNTALDKVYERRYILGDLADKPVVTTEEVRAHLEELHAEGISISERTFWYYLKDYRESGTSGLTRRQRSDKGHHHGISDRMEQIVIALRLQKKDRRITHIYEDACTRAGILGESEPSAWQVRDIVKKIPKPLLAIADGRREEFRNKYRLTYRITINGIVYQIDHTPVDVLVIDTRSAKYRSKSGEVRPWITLVLASNSRLVLDAQFGFLSPDRFTVAAAIRNALVTSETKPYGGRPDEIWVDKGRELVSNHVQQLASELDIILRYPGDDDEEDKTFPHHPERRSRVERFFGTLNTRLWCEQPGYVGSNTVERNPTAKAELTLAQLIARFWEFIDKYHHEVHSSTGQTPLDYWAENCFAEPVSNERLAVLLKEAYTRTVGKPGIQYDNREYWHAKLGGLMGQKVTIRVAPSYVPPDEIEVFHNKEWICTAFAMDSERGQAVDRSEIATAQRDQYHEFQSDIAAARGALAETDRQIEATDEPPLPAEGEKRSSGERKASNRKKESQREPDFLDKLAATID
jgi:putative transposase